MIKRLSPQLMLIAIIFIASLLRLFQLGHVPPSPDWDEASYGYNAYSMIKTGQDEYGAAFPVVLRSFDDYKPALYLYLVIPFVKLLGITTEAVRLPSALAGILAVFLTYHVVKLLIKRTDVALLAAFLLAVSPWHIQFSRIAFEANVGMLLNLAMVYFFLRGLKEHWFFIFSAISAGLSLYAYQSEKVFTPLLALLLVLVFLPNIRKINLKYLLSAVIVGLIIVLPMLLYLTSNSKSLTRARETSIFADKSLLTKNVERVARDMNNHDILGLVFDNRRVFYGTQIVYGYISHFSPNWLFITGDNERHHAPSMGLMYLIELPFLLVGLYALVFLKIDVRYKWLIFGWFLLAPVPASVTSGVPHAVRTINFLPLFQLFTALGLLTSWDFIRKLLPRFAAIGVAVLIGLLFVANVFYYMNQYFVQLNYFFARDWQYGYAEAVPFVKSISTQYDKIVVANKDPLDQSYIFFLYYLAYDPSLYHKEAKENSSGGFAETHKFGKYEFRPFTYASETKNEKTLYVGRPGDFPSDIKSLKTVYYPDNTPAIVVVGTK